MSVAFTAVANWSKGAQDLAGANEIVLAYSERRQALGQAAISPLSVGDNAQNAAYWGGMQAWLESNCTSFIDHVNGPLNPEGTGFLTFTLATWRAAASLNVNGFTRKYGPSGSLSTAYGNIQSGDVRGIWTFEELQRGLGALKSIHKATSSTAEPQERDGSYTTPIMSTCAAAMANQSAAWSSSPWGTSSGGYLYEVNYGLSYSYGQNKWSAWGIRRSGKAIVTGLLASLPHSADCYLKAPTDYNPNHDIDGLFSAPGVYSLIHSYGDESTDTRISSQLGGIDSNPLYISEISCPEYNVYEKGWFEGGSCGATISAWIIKYNFTNA